MIHARHSGLRLTLVLCVSLSLSACLFRREPGLPSSIPPVRGDTRTLFVERYIDHVVGTGDEMAPGRCVYAHYTGWLTDGTKFDSSRDTTPNGRPRSPIAFPQGFRRVIAGWDLGFEGMRIGGHRRLFIPYQLAYGPAGRAPRIPPKSELIFDVELVAMADTLPRAEGTAFPRCPTWESVRPPQE